MRGADPERRCCGSPRSRVGLLFGAILRTLPGARIEWSSLWIGALGTGVLFMVTKTLIARIIASTGVSDYYGAGASVVTFLVWVYLSTQIFFLGAEFTKVWSRRRQDPGHDEATRPARIPPS